MTTARALICTHDRQFTLEEFPIPELRPTEMLIQTSYSGVSVGTEFAVIRGKLDWGSFPLCTGYQAVGTVVAAGQQVQGYREGDIVYYRRNYLPMQQGDMRVNTVAGTHCSVAVIDPAQAEGIALLPPGADQLTSSMFVMPAVGFNAVNMAGVQMGDIVVVQGMGLIGLGALLAAALRGAVTNGIDVSSARLELGRSLGVDHVITASTESVGEQVRAVAPGGADVVFEGTGIPAQLDSALQLCRHRGKFVFLGNYGNAPISYRFLVPHTKEVTAYYPCNDGLAPSRRAVIKLMASGALPWRQTISHAVEAAEAPALYEAIDRNALPDLLGAVLRW
jgi:2-desacetyl-2-hydroxyethyl bacteriochlorophyllide A dehydrogenase